MSAREKKTILLVEDEVIIAMTTKALLEDNGYEAIEAHNGEDAIRLAEENPSIDLVLMDIDLGRGIDGTEAARLTLESREIPIVFLTSHSEGRFRPPLLDRNGLRAVRGAQYDERELRAFSGGVRKKPGGNRHSRYRRPADPSGKSELLRDDRLQ